MGIKGLHGLLKSIQKPCNLKKFSGQTLGVDAYGWLHRGTVACAVDLVLDKPTAKHIEFVLNRVRMLLYFGVTPYLVFDGDDLPSKSGTESDRHKRRQDSKALGLELQRKGRIAEAYQELQKAVDVTPLMARQLIEELKKMNVQYVVAPYEADAQLVYLERQGVIHGIISEDSDMLVFGARRLLSKLDQHGDCIEINRAEFTACRDVSFIGWTDADFRRMCILSGCDYLANIPRLGLKTAYRSIRKHKNVERALRMLQFDGQYHVPSDYLENFKQAERTFLYQRVFCPQAGKLVTLSPLDNGVTLEEMPFIGADVDPEIAIGVAQGDLDPNTKEPLVVKPMVVRNIINNSVNRRQTLGSSAELKPNKPISSFFTPKRVPLAELDPNTLTPSPSQQRLLQRHANTSWQSNSVDPIVRSAPSSGFSSRLSSPVVRSAERSSFLAHTSRIPALQTSKRQRLCSEADEPIVADRSHSRSRFFTIGSDDSSPSGQKVTRSKKARKSTLDVFSDEIAEDIMSQMPDPSQGKGHPIDQAEVTSGPQKARKEITLTDESLSTIQENAHATEGKNEDKLDENGAPPEVGGNSPLDVESNPQVFHQVLDYHITKQNSSLLSKYVFHSGDSQASAKGETVQSPRSIQSPGPTTTASKTPGPCRSPSRRHRLTPLQRLGQSALARSRSLHAMGPSRAALSKEPRGMLADSPKPAVRGSPAQGSEDLIIPDSDEDPEEMEDRPSPVAFDLKRFSFGG
ncbi:Rad2 nuclease [Aspergillus nanangensis]|uniref:Rad2 nuclease n=1 Tax=Aspergillus nanangensis TaxID=2582783 RepID=A0AAD4GXP9_ASPNN|nr:Rad2 nuclease [Aspergillus nanangensis]